MKARDRTESVQRRELRWAVFGFGVLFALLLVLAQLLAASAARSESAAAHTSQERALDLETLDLIRTTIRDRHFDPMLGGPDRRAVRDALRPHVERVESSLSPSWAPGPGEC